MMTTRQVVPAGETAGCKCQGYLVLLQLRAEDLDELSRQGHVLREQRKGIGYFRLRFRRRGRQVAIGLGKDSWLAEGVARELVELQANRRMERKHKQLIRTARGVLRRTKRELEAALQNTGYRFYGYEIRRQRDNASREREC